MTAVDTMDSTPPHINRIAYRGDIDGLRALSVIAVILYHFGGQWAQNGFIGVDIFFVISGFLITKILNADIHKGEFRFLKFYERRARRILPALFLVMICTLLAGYFILGPVEYHVLGQSAVYTTGFVSNLFFFLNVNYFSVSAESMPLLHTWSLGVEEQFYIFWPMLLLVFSFLLGRKRNSFIFILLLGGVVLLASIAGFVALLHHFMDFFYLTTSRIWEFLIGSMLVFLPAMRSRRQAEYVAVAGFAVVVLSVVLIPASEQQYGYLVLVACMGVALLIHTGPQNTFISRLLSMNGLRTIGLMSYSLYLWHWPVLVYYRHYTGAQRIQHSEIFVLLLVIVALSFVSWRYVELPFRNTRSTRKIPVNRLAIPAVSVVAASVWIIASHGFPGRLPQHMQVLAHWDAMWKFDCSSRVVLQPLNNGQPICVLGARWDQAKVKGVLWGDSHAAHYSPLIDTALLDSQASVLLLQSSSCAPFIDGERVRFRNDSVSGSIVKDCVRHNHQVKEFVVHSDDLDFVVMGVSWTRYPRLIEAGDLQIRRNLTGYVLVQQALGSLIGDISGTGKSSLMLSVFPAPGIKYKDCYFNLHSSLMRTPCKGPANSLDAKYVSHRLAASNKVLQAVSRQHDRAHVLFVNSRFCQQGRCPTVLQGEYIFRDANHLRRNLTVSIRQELVERMGLRRFIFSALQSDARPVKQASGPM